MVVPNLAVAQPVTLTKLLACFVRTILKHHCVTAEINSCIPKGSCCTQSVSDPELHHRLRGSIEIYGQGKQMVDVVMATLAAQIEW